MDEARKLIDRGSEFIQKKINEATTKQPAAAGEGTRLVNDTDAAAAATSAKSKTFSEKVMDNFWFVFVSVVTCLFCNYLCGGAALAFILVYAYYHKKEGFDDKYDYFKILCIVSIVAGWIGGFIIYITLYELRRQIVRHHYYRNNHGHRDGDDVPHTPSIRA